MYIFKTKPFKHQEEVLENSWQRPYYGLFMEMGLGKSKVIIDTIGKLKLKFEIDSVMIVAPKGVYDNWVKQEIPNHLPDEFERFIVRWQPNNSKIFQDSMQQLVFHTMAGIKFFVINVEAFSTDRGKKAAYYFLKKNPDNMMVIDESTTIKNRKASRTKNLLQLSKYAKYKRILTGSPVTKSPMDLYSQCAFLDGAALDQPSYFTFQNRYAVVQKRYMGARSFNEITGYRRLDELNEKLNKFSVRVLKEDCLDLPEKIYVKRNVPLTAEQTKLYAQMKQYALAKLDRDQLATTSSVLTQIMRLQQICCGYLMSDEGQLKVLDNNRMTELLAAIEECSGKIIIWCNYTHDIKEIEKALSSKYGGDSVATYYGETKQEDRQATVDKFQDMNNPLRFFVGQPKTGGYGITLTAANTMIYYSNSYDLEIRLQSEDRAHRIGQKKAVTYIDLIVENTIDEKIVKSLREKIDLAGQVLGEEQKRWLLN
jgi:SNF2 family DNA or RNA helicase